MVDGAGYLVIRYKEEGSPVEVVYPEEGTPLATGPSVVFKTRAQPERRAAVPELDARPRGQQFLVDWARQYSRARPDQGEAERPAAPRHQADEGRPGAVEKEAEAIKKRYAQIFKV